MMRNGASLLASIALVSEREADEPVPLGQRFAADVAADVKHAAPLATLMNMVQWACLVRCCLPQDTRKMLTSVSMHACHSAT
jgi:hypothetical protein